MSDPSVAPALRRDDWRLSTVAVLLGSGAAVLASLLLRLLLARRLAPAGFGLFTLAVGIATALAGSAALGLGAAGARRISLLAAGGAAAEAGRAARSALLAATAGGSLAALLLAGFAPAFARGLDKPDLAALLRALAPAVLALAVGHAGLGIARAFGDVAGRALWRDALGGGLRILGVVIALACGGAPASVAAGFAAGVVAGELGFLLYTARRRWWRGPVGAPGLDRELLHTLKPYAAMGVLAQAAQWFDVLLLGALAPAAVVGLYGAARGLERVLELGSEAGAHRFLPAATAAHHLEGSTGLAAVYRQTRRLMLALLWPPLLLCLLAPGALLSGLFGAAYAGAGAALRVLAGGLLLTAVMGYNDRALLAAGEERRVARFTAVALLSGLTVAAVAVPWLGGTGAALGWAAMLAVQNLLCTVTLARRHGVSPALGGVARDALVAGGPPLLLWAALRGLGLPPLSAAVVAACTASAAVVGLALRQRRRGSDASEP